MGKHYHLIGIGGIGMGTLASLLLAKGHTVSGSDLKDNELTSQLRKKGAKVIISAIIPAMSRPRIMWFIHPLSVLIILN